MRSARCQPPTSTAERRVSTSSTINRSGSGATIRSMLPAAGPPNSISAAITVFSFGCSDSSPLTAISPPGAGAAMIRSNKNKAPALSMGRFPEPHLGECTQDGQPSSQGHRNNRSRTAANNSARRGKAERHNPAPPGNPSYTKTAGIPSCACMGVEIPPKSLRSAMTISGMSPILACSSAWMEPMKCMRLSSVARRGPSGTQNHKPSVSKTKGGRSNGTTQISRLSATERCS